MIFRYDNETDMLYVKFADAVSVESEEVAEGIVLDFDSDNRVIGIEIEDAGRRMDLERLELNSVPISNIIFSESPALA